MTSAGDPTRELADEDALDRGVDVSVIAPFWNEEGNLDRLADELRAALGSQRRVWEVLLVDDGSGDDSLENARAIAAEDGRFHAIALGAHRGKSAALERGRDLSRGEFIVTIDADNQDDPARIPDFLEALDGGLDVVVAHRQQRQESRARRLATRVFNWTVAHLTDVPLRDINAGLKAYRRLVLEEIPLSRGMHRFIAVVAHERGFSVGELPVTHRARFRGKSKYGAGRYVETLACLLALRVARLGARVRPRRMLGACVTLALIGAAALVWGRVSEHTGARAVGVGALALSAALLALRAVTAWLVREWRGAAAYAGAEPGEEGRRR